MPIDEVIRKKVVSFSSSQEQIELVEYLEEKLKSGEVSPQDVFEYARDYRFSKREGTPYVISADSINKLGVVVGKLDDAEQKALKPQYYKLAADRDSHWGCHNHAAASLHGMYGVEKSVADALCYIKKAVELDEDKPTHKLLLCQVLREDGQLTDSVTALVDYFKWVVKQDEKEEKIKLAIDLFSEMIEEFDLKFEGDEQAIHERCHDYSKRLAPILASQAKHPAFLSIQQRAYFIQAMCDEQLGKPCAAWKSHCQVTDASVPCYVDSVRARARLLKCKIQEQLGLLDDAQPKLAAEINAAEGGGDAAMVLDGEQPAEPAPDKFMLPQGMPLPVKFSRAWRKEAEWFDSLNPDKLEEEFKKRDKQLDKLIEAGRVESALIADYIKTLEEEGSEADDEEDDDVENKTLNPWEARREKLNKNIEELKEMKKKLEEDYDRHHALARAVFRRHAAESRFFQPTRSSKVQAIYALVEQIIDHRFSAKTDKLEPINLAGISGRLLITAERAFQEGVISLSNHDRPELGIPIVRKKSWGFGYGYNERSGVTTYGPIEQYQVADTVVKAEHRVEPKRQRMGDSFLPDHGTYSNDIYPFFCRLCEKDVAKEQKLASYMLRYGKTHQAVSLEELEAINDEADQEDVEKFNRICFLVMTKEQSQWHSATNEAFQLGMSVSLARGLIMIEAGFIPLEEIFKNKALLSIYSHTKLADNCSDVEESAQYIDRLYMAYLEQKRGADHVKFFKSHLKDERPPEKVLNRKQAHDDMCYVYGGDSDTDGEGYTTDLDIRM
ncbi:MAG: hypothetical protein K0U29_02495 [Gammaproteobacteria bacterium]|nr:hypothetical protein [Gammaproteobacteria bacterium]MCH9743779.1 hypothetical protein [Gammaproteobacteria bacterium]